MKFKKKKIVIAHRSASGYLPEHSLPAVALAYGWGVDYVEPDIVLTKDNKPIVLHDVHLDTTTNVATLYPHKVREDGRFYAIDFTLKQIRRLSSSERFKRETNRQIYPSRFPSWRSGFKIPSLREYIEMIQGLDFSMRKDSEGMGICVEIKDPIFHENHGKDIVKEVFKVLSDYGYNTEDSNAVIECFYPPAIRRLREELHCKMPLGSILGYNSWGESPVDYDVLQTDEELKKASNYTDFVAVYLGYLCDVDENGKISPSDFVSRAHKAGLKVFAYTHKADDLRVRLKDDRDYFFSDSNSMLDFLYNKVGVDALFTDFGDQVLDFLSKNEL